jgi:hypothetical protein
MVIPNFELLSLGMAMLCVGAVLTHRDKREKQLFKCPKCGAKEMRAKAGRIICKNGHRVTIQE